MESWFADGIYFLSINVLPFNYWFHTSQDTPHYWPPTCSAEQGCKFFIYWPPTCSAEQGCKFFTGKYYLIQRDFFKNIRFVFALNLLVKAHLTNLYLFLYICNYQPLNNSTYLDIYLSTYLSIYLSLLNCKPLIRQIQIW